MARASLLLDLHRRKIPLASADQNNFLGFRRKDSGKLDSQAKGFGTEVSDELITDPSVVVKADITTPQEETVELHRDSARRALLSMKQSEIRKPFTLLEVPSPVIASDTCDFFYKREKNSLFTPAISTLVFPTVVVPPLQSIQQAGEVGVQHLAFWVMELWDGEQEVEQEDRGADRHTASQLSAAPFFSATGLWHSQTQTKSRVVSITEKDGKNTRSHEEPLGSESDEAVLTSCEVSSDLLQSVLHSRLGAVGQWVGQMKRTRVEGLHVEVTDSVSMAGLFRLLRQQPVHSSDGGGHIIWSQVKGCGLFTRLLLQHRHNVVTLCPRD
ncbi:hypothetical protein F7725_000088 [Dissostichus mawsoni]|uniref:Uncharacterized protein n=1 Tax=Dissostichus mawsoni TaxID=36200 RepID=A0A7J5ZE15_DISMA|nr:hypothetical protein F7725_000088 [Dissostichus mawsoni]